MMEPLEVLSRYGTATLYFQKDPADTTEGPLELSWDGRSWAPLTAGTTPAPESAPAWTVVVHGQESTGTAPGVRLPVGRADGLTRSVGAVDIWPTPFHVTVT